MLQGSIVYCISICTRGNRGYSVTDDFWDVKFDIHKKLNDQLKSSGVVIPFPQRDVHIYEEK